MPPSSTRRIVAVVLSVLTLLALPLLSGCATRDDGPRAATASPGPELRFPVQLIAPGGKPVVIDHVPSRIVSLNPTATETLYTIGAGEQVVAVDDQSNFPERAPHTKLSGLTPNVEAIAKYKPDLVVLFSDAGGLSASLATLKIPALILPAAKSLDDAYAQMVLLGQATDHRADADALVGRIKADIAKTVSATPKPARQLNYFYELSSDGYTATSRTFVGSVLGLFGLANVADAAPTDYPQLNQSELISRNPDLIFLADTLCCAQNARSVAARPGWASLRAVQGGNVVELNDDIASRWGPRITSLVTAIGAAVAKAGK